METFSGTYKLEAEGQTRIEWKLEETRKGYKFSMSGSGRGIAGQCIEEIVELYPTDKAKRMLKIWREYHLNDLHAGTPEQELSIQRYFNGQRYDYDKAVQHLADVGLLTVFLKGVPFTYGHEWHYCSIPQSITDEIKTW